MFCRFDWHITKLTCAEAISLYFGAFLIYSCKLLSPDFVCLSPIDFLLRSFIRPIWFQFMLDRFKDLILRRLKGKHNFFLYFVFQQRGDF